MKYIIFVALTLCSCESPYECYPPRFYAGGMCVYSEGPVEPDEILLTVNILEQEVRAKGYDEVHNLEDHLRANNTQLEFIDSKLSVGCDRYEREVYACDMHIGGVNYGGTSLYVQYHQCLGVSALAHEILHSVEHFYLGGARRDHMTPWFFEEYAGADDDMWWDVIEVRMWQILTCKLDKCKNYRRDWICENLEKEDWSYLFPEPGKNYDDELTETIELPGDTL